MSTARASTRPLDPASQNLLRACVQRHRAGQSRAAETGYRELLRRYPDHPEVLNFLGVMKYQQRDLEEAAEILRRAVEQVPGKPGPRLSLAMVLQDSGAMEEALEHYRGVAGQLPEQMDVQLRMAETAMAVMDLEPAEEALERAMKIAPDDPEVLAQLGKLRAAGHRYAEAEEHLRRVTELIPDSPGAWTNLANVHQRTGRYDECMEMLDRALERDPAFAPALAARGNCLQSRGELNEAIRAYHQALRADPGNSDTYCNLGTALQRIGDADQSVAAFRRAVEVDPRNVGVRKSFGFVLFELGRPDEAVAEFQAAVEASPRYGEAWMGLVHCYEATNRVEEAKAALERARALEPDHGFIALATAKIERREGRDEEAMRIIQDALASMDLPPSARRGYLYELGKIHDRLERADEAMEALSEANRLSAEHWSVERGGDNAYARIVDDLATRMTERWVADWNPLPAAEDEGPSPVFLVGFPRSGTTLLDQVLDAHPDVRVLEEQPLVSAVYLEATRTEAGYPGVLESMDAGTRDRLRRAYRDALTGVEAVRPGVVYVDKLPLASSKAPLLARVFPEARFIFATRHPCDACLSCFMQDFGFNDAMANFYFLDSTVRLYDRVMEVWRRSRELLDLDVVNVRYEDLVDDLEREARRVLDFLGLPFDPVVLDHAGHAKRRGKINTPSYSQVSQPIYTHARFRWERYRGHLAPYLPQLAPWIDYHGYPDPGA